MGNLYIADCHFGHSAAIGFDRRPFENTEQMEEAMVAAWNRAVQPEDVVYILGDFCWGTADQWLRLLRRLRGKKVLIEGNHDLKEYPRELREEFLNIAPYLEVSDYGKNGRGRKVVLCHYPMPFYNRASNPSYYMLCGHVHVTAENRLLEAWTRELRQRKRQAPDADGVSFGQIYNVGCMMPWMNWTPRTLDEIVAGWERWAAETEAAPAGP